MAVHDLPKMRNRQSGWRQVLQRMRLLPGIPRGDDGGRAASVDDTRPASDASSAPLQEEGETREEASSVDVDSSVADGEAFEAAIGSSRMTGHESPDEMIREALVEVRSLADTVPPIIEVPEVLPLATVSACAAADERRVDEGRFRAESDGACAFNASSRDDASCSNASTQNPEDDGSSVAAEARAMFGAKDPGDGADGLVGCRHRRLERIGATRRFQLRTPCRTRARRRHYGAAGCRSDVRPQSQSYIAQPDKKGDASTEEGAAQTRAGNGEA